MHLSNSALMPSCCKRCGKSAAADKSSVMMRATGDMVKNARNMSGKLINPPDTFTEVAKAEMASV